MLEARDVTFSYGATKVLDSWTAQFRPGALTALTGPSGRGKSTLLYLLGLMLHPTRGQIVLNGRPVQHLPDWQRAQLRAHTFGFVFQDAALDATRTVLDNVTETALYRAAPRHHARRRALELLQRFDVRLRASHRPGQISGGQAQRIALCRALLNDPQVLLADEPTGNLDPSSAAVVLDAFRGQADAGAVVVIATHDPRLVEQCDDHITL